MPVGDQATPGSDATKSRSHYPVCVQEGTASSPQAQRQLGTSGALRFWAWGISDGLKEFAVRRFQGFHGRCFNVVPEDALAV